MGKKMAAMQCYSLRKNENPAYQNMQHREIKYNEYNRILKK